ncbi:translation factor Sua5 [Dissulfuribacter thermophilus]|uniref:Translation factor Sua5 n=1 Tax=Dissulfuribacter thermophilus TaxID=1156395 RepID=A0A1B9F6H8_9BACT|nr:L-threonylcarbamoyladenylate synthase [Dissulfuribacter thermophilus]OCC15539.1 translation factor Sua5 [Dissulfuribacter thermophilus]
MIIEIDPQRINPRQIRQIADTLRDGGIVVYPTDTCYGIGADIFNKKAIEKVYLIKGLPKNTPFSFVCPDLSDISRYAHVTDFAYRILKRYLPGPYTFVLRGSREVPKMMLTKRKTVGIRIPDHPVCLSIVKELGNPIISTSVSIKGGPILSDPREMAEVIGNQVDIIVDSGIILPEPSSVISLIDDEPQVLRAGKGDCSIFV